MASSSAGQEATLIGEADNAVMEVVIAAYRH